MGNAKLDDGSDETSVEDLAKLYPKQVKRMMDKLYESDKTDATMKKALDSVRQKINTQAESGTDIEEIVPGPIDEDRMAEMQEKMEKEMQEMAKMKKKLETEKTNMRETKGR